ncbi:CoxG family protein [Streptomyces sp. NPDC059853]|uniref:CoxG family protein n=1 Tax=Streptomyces sp. NPDC059853 TaxID=3346973 RepID=UPI0036581442
MEHEVYVPFSAAVLRSALADPERVARCVPGLELDREQPAGPSAASSATASDPVQDPDTATAPATAAGRLRLRAGNTSITYRGTFTLTTRQDTGVVTVAAEGREARGTGSAALSLTVVPTPLPDGSGTTLVLSGTVESKGRLRSLEARQREAAGRRLLERFLEALVAELGQEEADRGEVPPVAGAGGIGEPDDNERVIPGIPAPEGQPADRAGHGGQEFEDLENLERLDGLRELDDLEELDGLEDLDDLEALEDLEDLEDLEEDGEETVRRHTPAPEADFARRTMIGRSAEEVDHAPPRGRYAPEPPPGSGGAASIPLRWVAPAAALALASAVLVGRVLRKRR